MQTPSTNVTLAPIDPSVPKDRVLAGKLCAELAGDAPWQRLNIGPERLERSLFHKSVDCKPFVIHSGGAPVGVLTTKVPWLFGVYIELIGILAQHRNKGIGSATLFQVDALAREAELANVWLCVSSFNRSAQDFYARHGYAAVGTLEGLIQPDADEFLMRKRL